MKKVLALALALGLTSVFAADAAAPAEKAPVKVEKKAPVKAHKKAAKKAEANTTK